ncbi:unnamed protein product, partial [Strongylus vulgaris]
MLAIIIIVGLAIVIPVRIKMVIPEGEPETPAKPLGDKGPKAQLHEGVVGSAESPEPEGSTPQTPNKPYKPYMSGEPLEQPFDKIMEQFPSQPQTPLQPSHSPLPPPQFPLPPPVALDFEDPYILPKGNSRETLQSPEGFPSVEPIEEPKAFGFHREQIMPFDMRSPEVRNSEDFFRVPNPFRAKPKKEEPARLKKKEKDKKGVEKKRKSEQRKKQGPYGTPDRTPIKTPRFHGRGGG